MLKKLIIIEDGQEVQCNDLKEVVEILIDENYYNLTEEEKLKQRTMKALANTINNKMEVVEEITDKDLENKFVVKNEITYILSLLITNNILLLERVDADIFIKSKDKEKIKDNYIIVNKFAKEILKKMLISN